MNVWFSPFFAAGYVSLFCSDVSCHPELDSGLRAFGVVNRVLAHRIEECSDEYFAAIMILNLVQNDIDQLCPESFIDNSDPLEHSVSRASGTTGSWLRR